MPSFDIHIRDAGLGLAAIRIIREENVVLSLVDRDPVGNEIERRISEALILNPDRTHVVIRAAKLQDDIPAVVLLQVIDSTGHAVLCDPIHTTLTVPRGRSWVRQVFGNVPRAEHYVTVRRGSRGMRSLLVFVNARRYVVAAHPRGLRPDQEHTIDVAAAMVEGGENTITLWAWGGSGATAEVIISDTAPH